MVSEQRPRRSISRRTRSSALQQWTPAIAAAAILSAVVLVGVLASKDSTSTDGPNDSTTTIVQIVTPSSTAPVTKLPLTQTYGRGAAGPEIKLIQDRLIELKFDPGVADGAFGERTQQAVWAFEKLVMGVPRDQVTGKVTPEMWSRMQDPLVILPRRPDATPNHTEIYLPEQVLIVFHADTPVLVTHIASGTNEEWCEEVTISPGEQDNETGIEPIKKGVCGLSWTPGGVYKFYRMVVGRRESQLGGMYNPVYFNKGIAVHGAKEVPDHPASHGCIRIPMHISDYFQSLVAKGDQVFVFDGVKDPEAYGAQPPRFNWVDPSYTTTTTTTTAAPVVTLPPTTLAPVTTPVTTTTSSTTTTAPAPAA
ncbi:MAG: L,D-transpeptidase family protein [Actinomycetes bacterium]